MLKTAVSRATYLPVRIGILTDNFLFNSDLRNVLPTLSLVDVFGRRE